MTTMSPGGKALFFILNSIEFFGVLLVLSLALVIQFWFNEIPCPLCFLQRLGFMGIAFGLLLNIRYTFRPSHYAIALVSAIFTAFVALRQICLHVIPGTGVYGMAFFGLHLYTWSFIFAVAIIVYTTIMLGFERQYSASEIMDVKWQKLIASIGFVCLALIAIQNAGIVFAECGFNACPSDPVGYWLFK